MTKVIDNRTADQAKIDEDRKVVEAFLNDPDKKKDAIQLAHQIQKSVGETWFQAKKLLKYFNVTIPEIHNKIMVMKAFNLIATKEDKGFIWYKIDINKKDQRQLLVQEIEFHKAQILILTEKLSKLD